MHPVHILVQPPDQLALAHYDAYRHVLCWLAVDENAVAEVRRTACEFMNVDNATIILFAAEAALTMARYEDPLSLVWRDSGALQGQFGLVASGSGLAFCLLGTTSDAWLVALFGPSQSGLIGTGAALVGASD